jgi:hypothetical protein
MSLRVRSMEKLILYLGSLRLSLSIASQPLAKFKLKNQFVALLLLSGIIPYVLTSCAASKLSPSPSEPSIVIESTSLLSGASRALSVNVQDVTEGGGVAAIQGSITYDPSLVQIQELSGLNAFIVMAEDINNDKGGVRFAVVRVGNEGVSNGPIANILVKATGSPGDEAQLTWEGNAETPIVIGGNNNHELTLISLSGGRVKIR